MNYVAEFIDELSKWLSSHVKWRSVSEKFPDIIKNIIQFFGILYVKG
jgi:hypothetical protein